jgi:hypothetical protein
MYCMYIVRTVFNPKEHVSDSECMFYDVAVVPGIAKKSYLYADRVHTDVALLSRMTFVSPEHICTYIISRKSSIQNIW